MIFINPVNCSRKRFRENQEKPHLYRVKNIWLGSFKGYLGVGSTARQAFYNIPKWFDSDPQTQ